MSKQDLRPLAEKQRRKSASENACERSVVEGGTAPTVHAPSHHSLCRGDSKIVAYRPHGQSPLTPTMQFLNPAITAADVDSPPNHIAKYTAIKGGALVDEGLGAGRTAPPPFALSPAPYNSADMVVFSSASASSRSPSSFSSADAATDTTATATSASSASSASSATLSSAEEAQKLAALHAIMSVAGDGMGGLQKLTAKANFYEWMEKEVGPSACLKMVCLHVLMATSAKGGSDMLTKLRRAGMLERVFPRWLDEAHNQLATIQRLDGSNLDERVDSNNILNNVLTIINRTELKPRHVEKLRPLFASLKELKCSTRAVLPVKVAASIKEQMRRFKTLYQEKTNGGSRQHLVGGAIVGGGGGGGESKGHLDRLPSRKRAASDSQATLAENTSNAKQKSGKVRRRSAPASATKGVKGVVPVNGS